ncbi:YheC/YheD family protein [Ammoniphilus sp. CFH 90114]|uniref:YheC/YheD family protein n=1 Tax=Ammoniphilus sp. CFH 90114 TaxID=2493665 RepID=UPI0013E98912|nr:YheC/YheD family protein [Ammoniphilus sp. CFH 90114]
MLKHKVIRNKMRIARVLMKDPYLSSFIPETAWFSIKELERMLKKYKVAYVKPNKGLQGEGIIRIKSLPNKKFEISYSKKTKIKKFDSMVNKVIKLLDKRRDYLIQQGLDLATYENRPYDFRFLLVKHLDRWHLTMSSAKVAAMKDSIVTNVTYNSRWLPPDELQHSIYKVLNESDQTINPMATLRELMDLSYQIANTLGGQFPFYMLGLDLAVDKNGSIWFFEANTSPAIKPMKKVNDPKWFAIVKTALKDIEIQT